MNYLRRSTDLSPTGLVRLVVIGFVRGFSRSGPYPSLDVSFREENN